MSHPTKHQANGYYLKPNVIAEPLIDQWYAWSYLIPPATSARYLTESQCQVMQSFVDAPDIHEQTLKNPAMLGGPFIQHPPSRADEVRSLLTKTKQTQARLFSLSSAIAQLQRQLDNHPAGDSLEPLYAQLPEALKGYVELVYDAQNHANIRFIEGLLYRSEYYDPQRQSIALRLGDGDSRAFVMSTPRLLDEETLFLSLPFSDSRLDQLFQMRFVPGSVDAIAQQFNLSPKERKLFKSFFTQTPPHLASKPSKAYSDDGIRIRYMGHACVLIETADVSILCDPLVSYERIGGVERFSYADLPEHIDYALITHNHQDHVMLETLLQLRHKIGTVVVPSGQKGALLDPSLKLALQQIGFSSVRTLDEVESLPLPGGQIISLPVLGEHGDLNIATKTAYWIQLQGRSILCAADSNNLDPHLYHHIHHLFGDLDLLFIGMECDGAPFTWAYAPLLMRAISHRQAQARRLDGSNAERAQALIDRLNPAQVCVYAMGQEPWLTYITSIEYAPDDAPIIESNRLVEHCRAQGRECDRPFGKKQIELSSKPTSPRVSSPIPVTHQPSLNIALDNTKPAPSQQINSAVPQTKRTQKHTQQTHAKANREKSSATPLTTLLTELKSLDIRLWIEGDTLRCNAPKGKLTPLLTTQIKSHKPDIIALLKGQNSSTIADSQQASEPDWKPDISLPPEIVPAEMCSATTTSNQQPATAVLLTGATGFLGTFLLYELLQQTSATVYCLVRGGAQPDAGLKKIKTCLSDYGIWQDTFTDRVIPFIGDLSQRYLGLSKTDFHQLADHIHTIYHNGAQVHHLAPYAQLRATNVLGTLEVLKLACNGMPKPLHYISTLSVFPPVPLPGKHRIDEHDDLSQYPIPAGGYNRSKWVAEQLVTQARDRNLPVSIYRPGPLSGHSETGLYNPNDFLYRLMQGYVQSGMAPQGNLPLDLLPVDYASKAIVYLSQQSSTLGKAFHLIHPHPASSDLLFEACQSAGYDIERVPYHVWHNKLQQIAHNDPTHPLYPLVALFSSRRNISPPEATDNVQLDHLAQSSHEIPFSTANTYSHLENAPFDLPPLNQELFNTYLQKMTRKPINSE